jgi:S1-C subfamily serine protease
MNAKVSANTRILFMLGLLLPTLALACSVIAPRESEAPAQITPVAITQVVTAPPETVSEVVREVVSEDQVLVDLYQRVNPAVVNITTYGEQGGFVVGLGEGSGFIYDDGGNIVTNAHVVHGADQVEVTFADGLTRKAEVVGEDLHSDLAVVRVDPLPEGVHSLPLGSIEDLAVGQTVVAIGNPFGLQGTLTRGIISALGRTIPALTVFSIPQSIQTDAAINPGNSGGPLLNLEGEVIGVNAQIETGGTSRANSGVGFAIPVSIVERVIPTLIENGKYDWAWLGVRGGDVDPSLVEAMNLPVERGAYLWQIEPNGPADLAGLQGSDETVELNGRQVDIGGDVVIAVNGQNVNTFDDLLIYIALKAAPDQEITLTILRNGESQDVTVRLAPRPSS